MSVLLVVMNVLTFASTMLAATTVPVCKDTLFWRIPGHVPVCMYLFMYVYVTVHAKMVIFVHLTEMVFLISVESLDITTSNSTSGGFISISVIN